MDSADHIRFIKRDDIDIQKWDQCIADSCNSLIYAKSFYLDHMAKHWDALVAGDYASVMPLVWNQKWGIKYLYQPPFTQQLGVFSIQPLKPALVQHFLEIAASKFRFLDVSLNYANTCSYPLSEKANFVLSLHSTYEELRENYKTDLIKNLKKAATENLTYSTYDDLDAALQCYQDNYGKRVPHVQQSDYTNFANLCHSLNISRTLILRKVLGENNKLLAIGLLLKDHQRIYLIQSTTTAAGRILEANHFLLDSVIREFSGKDLMLDFEGSDIPGIAHFYKNFGTMPEPYFFLRLNNLPWPLKLFKR
jgi:hypothetical protein